MTNLKSGINMKNVFTLALLLIAASILISSCSQFSNSTLLKSHSQEAFYAEQGTINQSEPVKVDNSTFSEKGYSAIQTDRELVNDPIIEKNKGLYIEQPQLPAYISNTDEEQNKAVVSINKLDVKGINANSKESISTYRDKPNIAQPANFYNRTGHSNNGVPFWLIVVCAILIPPLGVALAFGITDKFWICLLLTLVFWLPGMIYALIQIL
jgi:uncharacterized membrane protein YqaE (UPF0057 family)